MTALIGISGLPVSRGLVLAAEEGEPSPLLPHTSELIVGIVAFALLYLFLRAKVFPIFERTFAERRDAIEGGIERAEQAQAEANRLAEAYRAQMAEARQEAARLREEARAQGAAIVAEMREEGQRQREAILAAGHQQLEADRKQAAAMLRAEIGALATELASRIVGESLEDEVRQRRTVDRFIAELEARERAAGDGQVGAGAPRTGP
jgi:F-type H+-transporting ATPase subunit b